MQQQKIPGSVVKAIGAVMSQIETVKKSQDNRHGGYKFASTDDIYAAVTQKMGEVGLVIVPMEERADIKDGNKSPDGKQAKWLDMVIHFVLATQEDTWDDPRNKRSILVQITGPQTFQAAQSYCEKAFLRGLFKIPTGDMDIDSLPEGFDYNPLVRPVAPPPPPAAQAPAAPKASDTPNAASLSVAAVPEPADNPVVAEPSPIQETKEESAPLDQPAEGSAPDVDWAARLRVLAETLRKMTTAGRMDDALARFHAAFEGDGIPHQVAQDAETLVGQHKARVSRAPAA